MYMDKKELRKFCKEKIKYLSDEYKKSADNNIFCKIINNEYYQKSTNIFLYVSTKYEPDTIEIIKYSLKNNKNVCVPKCIDKSNMKVCIINNLDDLQLGLYGILEPKEYCKEIKKSDIEFALVPCVCCDEKGNRLGHGAGYYDKFLKNTTFKKAVICYNKLIMNYIPININDVVIDIVIHDN